MSLRPRQSDRLKPLIRNRHRTARSFTRPVARLLEMSHLQTNTMMPADQGLLTRQSRRTTTLIHAMFSWDRVSQ
jgi:hypothetical protein